jgi:hypothetical protein
VAIFVTTALFALFTTFAMAGLVEFEWYPTTKKSRFILFVVGFLLAMASGFTLMFEKGKLEIERAQKFLNSKENKSYRLRVEWFETCLAYKNTEYLGLAESLDKATKYREKYKSYSDFSAKDIAQFIFADDSKPRVLAMFLMLSAMLATLSVKDGATLTSVLEFYSEATPRQLLWIFFYAPSVIFIGYLEIKYCLIALARVTERFFERLNGKNAYSKRKTRIFINELIRQCSLEKPRIKHDGESYRPSLEQRIVA